LNFEIWKNKKYVIWAIAIPTALFGYFVPYVHMVKLTFSKINYRKIYLCYPQVKFVSINFPEADGKILVMCIGVTSGVGRIIFGKIADMPNVDRILLQQVIKLPNAQ